MTWRASAPSQLALVAAMSVAEAARAGVWYTEPVLGLQADYSTNPGLVIADHTATTDGAVLIDVPTAYSADAWKFALKPSFRFTDNSGYSSLVSNYQHLTAMGEFDSERNTLKVTASAERDSSLYQDYNLDGSVGVRQDTAAAELAWDRTLTERLSFDFDGNYQRVRFGESNGVATLTDYAYSSATPSLSWSAGRRTTLSLLGSYSWYDSLDGTTRSTDLSVELGFSRQLSELWTVSAKAGYSREQDRYAEYFGPYLLGTFETTENGTVYSANLTRQGDREATTLVASRTLTPAGYNFLSRRDLYALQVSYPYSERWTLQGLVRYRKEQDPQFFAPTVERKYADVAVSVERLLTENWTLTLTASHIAEKVGPPDVSVANSGLSVGLSRRFNRIEWR
jgi:hypothetical protein